MEKNRGIGLQNSLPWPSLPTDYQHYISLSQTPTVPGKKTINIVGRNTWNSETTEVHKMKAEKVIHIIISSTLEKCPDHAGYLVRGFEEALRLASSNEVHEKSEDIWVLGGEPVLKLALRSPWCRKVYLTRIEESFVCDSHMPEFEHNFNLRSDPKIISGPTSENGVNYRFEVYTPKQTSDPSWTW